MQAIFGMSLKTPIPMKKPWRLQVFLIAVLFTCLVVFILGQRRAFGTGPSVEPKASSQDDVPGETQGKPAQSSMKADPPVRRRDERVTPEVSRQGALDQMRPSQVAGRVPPKVDPDTLACRAVKIGRSGCVSAPPRWRCCSTASTCATAAAGHGMRTDETYMTPNTLWLHERRGCHHHPPGK